MMEPYAKVNLRNAYENKDFQAVIEFKEVVLDQWRKQNAIGETEFETLRATFEKEFKIQGLEEFFDALYKEIYDVDEKV